MNGFKKKKQNKTKTIFENTQWPILAKRTFKTTHLLLLETALLNNQRRWVDLSLFSGQ